MYNVQETQNTVSKQTGNWVLDTFIFAVLDRLCIRILVQAIDTL